MIVEMISRLAENIAWILPRQIVYFCAIRVGVHATTGRFSNQIVGELTFLESLHRWARQ